MSTQLVDGRLRTVRGALVVAGMSAAAAGAIVLWLSRSVPMGEEAWGLRGFSLVFAVVFSGVGWWIVRHRDRNRVGWALLVAGMLSGIQGFCSEWTVYALGARDGAVAGGVWTAWIVDWIWIPSVALAGVVFLLFPDGRPLNDRWGVFLRFVPWGAGISATLLALKTGPLQTWPVDNPVGVLPYPMEMIGLALLPFFVVLVGAVVSLILRARRASGIERTQLRWVLAPAVPTVGFIIASGTMGSAAFGKLMEAGAIAGIVLLMVGIGVGIVRYQLFDIDLAINRTLVVGALVAFVTVVYAAIVGGVGALVGERANLTLSMAATGLVAVGFHPVRQRVQHWSNRLVYGERATPYEVLSTFASRLEGSVATDDLLQRITGLLAEGTGATSAQVWLRVGDELRVAAAAPPDPDATPVSMRDSAVPAFPHADHRSAVVHRGELLGALTITKPRGEPVSQADEKLVDGLAAQAGLLLRNQRLTAELVDLVEQLRASRQRLVAAQDEERRRLERDLHDGAQQQIVALKLTAATARTLLDRGDTERTGQLLDRLVSDTDEAVASLRELAHGIYPPLLAAEGLGPALRARAAKAPVDVKVAADGARYPREVEAAVYFCVLEALQNIVKYAGADHVRVEVARVDMTSDQTSDATSDKTSDATSDETSDATSDETSDATSDEANTDGGQVRFVVTDDGQGFDVEGTDHGAGLTNMSDRMDALGGHLTVRSTIGAGTTVAGVVPLQQAREQAGDGPLDPAGMAAGGG